ncbi:sigma factor-like helix-turn-helix DNA-binding protein [Sorangium sp. So ce327]|uniref:sigma factor-like helix-turn-helix DNA-binding protein n=1 Tax=Sorangium sp. So ce327 TaxID=3133301 RepID=UPI003F5E3393
MATVSDSELEIFGLDGADAAEGDRDPAGSTEPVVEGALALQADPAESGNAITREQRRSRRKREIRARTISVKRMTKRELEIGRMLYPETDYYKPRARAECVDGPRPCPYVSCQHHLYLDVSARTGAIKLNFPDLEVWDMNETCALDVADRGGTTLEDVGAIMNLTRERIRQVEVKALAKLEALKDMSALRDYVDEGPVGKRRLPVLTQPDDDDDEDEVDEDEDEATCADGDADDEGLDATSAGRPAELEDAGDFDGGE